MILTKQTTPRGEKENKMPNNTVYSFEKPTKEDIDFVISNCEELTKTAEKTTSVIKADVFNMNKKTKSSQLTVKFDSLLNNDKLPKENKDTVKRFIRTVVQPIIKAKACQEQLLNEDLELMTITIKKVNENMVNDKPSEGFPLGKMVDSFSKNDLGKYKVVRSWKKQKEEKTPVELLKIWMKANGYMKGEKYETKPVNELLKEIDSNQ